jgi:hypothetical protein
MQIQTAKNRHKSAADKLEVEMNLTLATFSKFPYAAHKL